MKEFKRHGANVVEVVANDGTRVLFSYDQPVAAFVVETDSLDIKAPPVTAFVRTSRFWSRTTSRHVAEWLQENGADALTVDQETINRISREAR